MVVRVTCQFEPKICFTENSKNTNDFKIKSHASFQAARMLNLQTISAIYDARSESKFGASLVDNRGGSICYFFNQSKQVNLIWKKTRTRSFTSYFFYYYLAPRQERKQ